MFIRQRSRSAVGAALLAAALAPGAASAQTTHAYGIAQFGGAGQCGAMGDTHAVHTNTAGAFLTPFTLLAAGGLWGQASAHNNTSARGSYFTDASKAATCSCAADDLNPGDGADDADVLYVHTHGARSTSAPYRTALVMGNSAYACRARTNEHMRFGNAGGRLDIAVVKACQSGDYDVWRNGGYRQQFTTSDSSFTVWNAFHGDSSCGDHVTAYAFLYAMMSIYDGVGENWIDVAYDDSDDANEDDCPVSIVMGSSASARDHMYEHGGWRDRENTGPKTGSSYYYIQGCDPSSGVALPQ